MTHFQTRGFTLIEMLVSTAIFTIVMVIALGALLAMSDSDRKAQTLKAVINNLDFSLDSMTRAIRTGENYHCESPTGLDCPTTPATYIAFTDADGNHVAYCEVANAINGNGTLYRQVAASANSLDPSANCGSSDFSAITAPEVDITNFKFYVEGSCSASGNDDGPCTADFIQPKVTILLQGQVQVSASEVSSFNLQTSVTQRLYDE